MTMEIFRHYSAILDQMLQEDYWKFYFQEPFQREYGEWLDDNKTLLITNGCSRGCIVDENYNWVVKFNLCDTYDCDACNRELSYYNDAKLFNLNMCFSECHFIGTYRKKIHYFNASDIFILNPSLDNDEWIEFAATQYDMEDIVIEIPLYAYRKVEEAHIPWSLCREDCELGNKIRSPIADEHIEVAVALWKNWGEELFMRFDYFCRKHHIDDLHSSNVGEVDGHLVILDYAGYRE